MDSKFVYKGETLQGVRHGHGQYNYPGGVFQYKGPWEHGVKQGKEGKFSMPGYFEHTGEFVDGEMTGRGQRDWADGRSYDGEWVGGEMHGKGSWANTRTSETYDGDFDSNRRHGKGTLKLSNGDIYDGEFRAHRYEGKGAYLKEKDFVVEGYFKNGCVDGTAKASWHKKGCYEGSWKEGHIVGALGQFVATDGSYQYIGPFADSSPELKPTGIYARCDRTVVPAPESAAPEKGKKEAKKPAKGKDANAESANTATVTQGTQIGDVHIALTVEPPVDIQPAVSSDTPINLPVAGVAFGQVALPLNELRRRVAIRLRPYVPPPVIDAPKGGKGKAAAEPVSTEPPPPPGLPVPLWVQQPSLQNAADAWGRFPPNCLKFFRGSCGRADVDKKLTKHTQGSGENATPAEAQAVYESGPHGVNSVALDASSALMATIPSVVLASKFAGIPMPEDIAAYVAVVDFCLDTSYYQKMDFSGDDILVSIPLLRVESIPSAKESELGRKQSALTLSFKVVIRKGEPQAPEDPECNAEAKVEAAEATEAVTGEATPASVLNEIGWSEGVWELISPAGYHEWGGGLSVPENWHSVGVSVKHSTWTNNGDKVKFSGIDLVVDGANRRKMEGKKPVAENSSGDMTAVVVDWLSSVGALNAPCRSPNQEAVDDENQAAAEAQEGQEAADTFNVEAAGGDISVVVGGQQASDLNGTGEFVGSIASLAMCNRDDMCDVVESTSCFADWVKEKLILIQRSEEAEAAASAAAAASAEAGVDETTAETGDSPPSVAEAEIEAAPSAPSVPLDCVESLKATVVCRGGYAVCEGIVVPPSTEEGLYVLEISDDVDIPCRAPESEPEEPLVDHVGEDEHTQEEEPPMVEAIENSTVPQPEPIKPEMTSRMCEMAPRLLPNLSILISVVAAPPPA